MSKRMWEVHFVHPHKRVGTLCGYKIGTIGSKIRDMISLYPAQITCSACRAHELFVEFETKLHVAYNGNVELTHSKCLEEASKKEK